jgi:hypothetical protein
MAGFYPDVPGQRFAYHLDGTKIYLLDDSNVLTDITSIAATINDEDADYANVGIGRIIFLFPEKRNLSGYYFDGYFQGTNLYVSSDTTTLLDGTWTSIANPWIANNVGDPLPEYRQNINPITAGSVKALKFTNSPGNGYRIYSIHLYGSIAATENPDRLIFWNATLDQATDGPYFDWGDVVQGQSYTKTFRIKNNSSSKTAQSIGLSAGAETFGMAVQFSTDNVTYTPTLTIGDLAPGAISSTVYVKRSVPASEPLQLQVCRFKASAGSWV